MSEKDYYLHLLKSEVKPIKLGNKNKSGKCGMCSTNVKKSLSMPSWESQFYDLRKLQKYYGYVKEVSRWKIIER